MRAWRVNELGHPSVSLTLEEVASPRPGRGEARVRVEATNVNFADILVCQGIYQDRPGVPLTPGTECCGVVVEVGEGVDLPLGRRVAAMTVLRHGGYGEEALVKAATALEMPAALDAADATVLYSTFQTAHVGLFHRGRLESGQWLLVHGAASGVGAAAVQLGAERGARVIATAGGPERAEHGRALGAELVVDSRSPDAPDELYAATMAATGGTGVDVAFDPVGGPLGGVTRRLMAWEGRLVVIGFASGDVPSYPGNHILVKNYAVLGMAWSDYAARRRDVVDAAHGELLALHAAGRLRTDVERVALADVPAALAALEERRVTGRLVMVP
ncbi:MAG: NADPH:quinone oxidoreductase family protein [Acidimicrobiia bacterium]|nr:NADPH:quinone oxidoreductase family protein [Acidimicrobiia bacterium]